MMTELEQLRAEIDALKAQQQRTIEAYTQVKQVADAEVAYMRAGVRDIATAAVNIMDAFAKALGVIVEGK